MGAGLIPEPVHVGPLPGIGPGRKDVHDISVPAESFVIPADVVGAIGQGNTANGFAALEKMFPARPVGRAAGGGVGSPVPIVAAGGEYVVGPEHVRRVGGGDIKRGHGVLRNFVTHARAEHIKTLKKLPGPARG